MANLTGSQKKKRSGFVALLIAILVVAAAIFYVVFSGEMAKSTLLENQDFATALGDALGKYPRSISEEDLAAVKYVEIYSDGTNCGVYLGYDDFVAQYDKYMAQVDAAEKAEEAGEEEIPEITEKHPVDLAKAGVFVVDAEALTLNDVKYFTGAEIVNFTGFNIDSSVISSFKNLKEGYFSANGLTDVSAFSELDLTKIEELSFMSNSISDWSPLESIADKVEIINYGFQMTEDGQYTVVPQTMTLAEKLEADAKAAEEAAKAEEEAQTEEVATEETTEEAAEETTDAE